MNHSCFIAIRQRNVQEESSAKCEIISVKYVIILFVFSNICCFVLLPSVPVRDTSGFQRHYLPFWWNQNLYIALILSICLTFACHFVFHLSPTPPPPLAPSHLSVPFFSSSPNTSLPAVNLGLSSLQGAHPLWERHYWQTCTLVRRIYSACMDIRSALTSTTSFGSFAGWPKLHTKGI